MRGEIGPARNGWWLLCRCGHFESGYATAARAQTALDRHVAYDQQCPVGTAPRCHHPGSTRVR